MTLRARLTSTWGWTIIVLYVLVVGLGGGLVLGAGIASVVLVPGVFEKATGLLASTAVTGLAVGTFRLLPSLTDDESQRTNSKRFLVVLILVSAFLGGWTFIRLGNQGKLPFGIAQSIESRMLEIEADVGNLKETFSADVYREDRLNQSARVRRWWRIPTTPGQRYQLQAELTGVRSQHWIEIVVTDERGQLLAGRRTRSSPEATVSITSGQSWFVNVGVRWWSDGDVQAASSLLWPNGTRPSDDQKLETGEPESSGLIRVTRHPETTVVAQASPPGAGAVDIDQASFRASADATQSTSYLASSCGGAFLDERAYTLDVPADSWIHVEAESREPVLLYVMKSNAMIMNEVSCDRDAFAVTAGAATLQSELDVAVPRGKYVIVVDGLMSVHQDVRLSGGVAALGLGLEDGSSHMQLESSPITARVDLLGTQNHGHECGDDLVRYYRDVEVTVATAGLYRAEVGPSPEYESDKGATPFARAPFHVRWLKDKTRDCADVADRTFTAGETAVLRLVGNAGVGPDVGGLDLHLVAQKLEPKWCQNAVKFDAITKRHPLVWSGTASAGPAVFTTDQCPDALAGQPPVAGGGQAFAQFKLTQDTVLAMTGHSTSSTLETPQVYIVRVAASAEAACDREPKVVACCVVSGATKIFTLPVGSYYVVVGGQHKTDAGAFAVELHRLASAPRPDGSMAL